MDKNVIYHNPRCSKSRQTLELLNKKSLALETVEYLNEPPLESELKYVCDIHMCS